MKTEEILKIENDNRGRVALFPEGMFYHAYEMSAFIIAREIHPFKVSRKHIKCVGRDIVSLGFPKNALHKWMQGWNMISDAEGVLIFDKGEAGCLPEGMEKEFLEWKNSVPVKSASALCAEPAISADIEGEIKEFPLESSTPIDCVNFIAKLKKLIYKNTDGSCS